jgi:N6-adenosine-specific RNA methylase IME4
MSGIYIGQWYKGKEVENWVKGVGGQPNYSKIEQETGRERHNLKKWHDLYKKYPDQDKFIEKYVSPKVKELTQKWLESNKKELLPPIETPPLPEGKYNIILADPPWQYWEGGEKNQSQHYNTMTLEEIKQLPVQNIAGDNCILFLWATFPYLKETIEVMETWGFKYSTVGFVWVKSLKDGDGFHFGCGSWTRANAEICLIGTKGSIDRKNASISQIIYEPIREHSRKPDSVREKIVQLVGALPRIELFARQITEGWDVWGNETNGNKYRRNQRTK